MITQIVKELIEDTKFRLGDERTIDIQGFKMWINPKDTYVMRKTFRAYNTYRVHEKATTNLFKSIIKTGDLFVDIGANIGYFSMLALYLGARVHAFEPEAKNVEYIRRNALTNHKEKDIIVSEVALSNEDGTGELYLCPYDSGHHTMNQNKGITDYRKTSLMRKCLDLFTNATKKIEVDTVVFDELQMKPDVIKMDCEGSELLVLEGMDKTLKENKNIKMIVEFFPLLIKSMGSSPEVFINKLLTRYGFTMFIVPDDYNAGISMVEIKSYEQLMSYCPNEEDHVNLYLTRI